MRFVINAQKDDVFRIRMNSEIKNELEEVFAKNGLTLTDAVNVFFQQVLNTGGFPFSVTEDNAEKMKTKALSKFYNVALENKEVYDKLSRVSKIIYNKPLGLIENPKKSKVLVKTMDSKKADATRLEDRNNSYKNAA